MTWGELLKDKALKAGWQLSRNDSKNDFIRLLYYTDTFTASFDDNLTEIKKRLSTHTYSFSPLYHIDVPKSTLAVRPGSLPRIEDRIVLHASIRLLALELDKLLPDAVHSYRLKKNPKGSALFRESDVLDIPYLKSKIIKKHIDPVDPWYLLWPEFDEKSKSSYLNDGYIYLAVSDISAYFENIQLPILRDLLHKKGSERSTRIVNIVMEAMEDWSIKTSDGQRQHRGIPQGTEISSFLGNIFLLPLDEEFAAFCETHDARYLRYMDDVRIFTKTYEDARKALSIMDRMIRSLHLNVQSAKTKILCESSDKEISRALSDPRLDEINDIISSTPDDLKKLSRKKRTSLFSRLEKVAKQRPYDRPPLLRSRSPLDGMTLRVFRRWITAHRRLGSQKYLPTLVREIQRTPDQRLTRALISFFQKHPRSIAITKKLLTFIKSDQNIFDHQEAEIINACRYLFRVPDDIVKHCEDRFLERGANYYVRAQCAYLLSRVELKKDFIGKASRVFNSDSDTIVQSAAAGLMMQSTGRYGERALERIALHPNDDIRKLGRFFWKCRNDFTFACDKM